MLYNLHCLPLVAQCELFPQLAVGGHRDALGGLTPALTQHYAHLNLHNQIVEKTAFTQ